MKPEHKILLIVQNTEESSTFRSYLEKSERFKLHVFEAENDASSFEIIQKEKPDCVLIDADEGAILEKIAADSSNEAFSLILLLDKSDETLAEDAIKSGAQNVYFKNSSNGFELRQKVESEIEKIALRRELAGKDISRIERRFHDTFYDLVQKSPFGIFVIDSDFQMSHTSPSCRKAFNNIDPLIGRDFAEILKILWVEPLASDFEHHFRHTLKTGEPYHSYVLTEQRGNISDTESYDWKIERVILPDGTFGVVAYFYDLTDLKNTEKALRNSEENYRVLFESINEGFMFVDVIFDDDRKPLDFTFAQANPSFWRLSGLPESIIGKTATEAIPGLESFWLETYSSVALTGKSIRFENYAEELGRWFDVYASRVGGEDSNRVAVVFNNITGRKTVEQERERSLEMEKNARRIAEENNRAKDDFLTMLSHELRAPLNAIYGWTQLLQKSELDKDKVREALEVIDRNVRLQSALIEDLLDVSRIITNKMKLDPAVVSLISSVEKAIKAISPSAEDKSLTINLKIATDADEVLGDKNRLRQIIDNIFTNAVKFTPEGGEINVSLDRDGDKLKLSVEDNGIGISPDILPYVFDRFSQGDGGSKRRYGGLGLGLAIVKHLVDLHDGKVSAHSDGDGKGSRFTIEFPLASDVVKEQKSSADVEIQIVRQENALAGKRILIVDDDRDVLNFLSLVIKEEGADVTRCNLASDALKKLKAKNFDLLISDLGMEPIDGFDLIREIRAERDEYFQKLPAIALTGYVSAQDRELALAAGFQDHIAKPVKLDNLLAIIGGLLDK